MAKAKAHPDQLGFDFSVPAPQKGVAELAGIERQINELVGTILASDERPREVIAAAMSVLLDEQVTRPMLDAYSSPARSDHRVPFSRLCALIVVTDRQDLLRPLLGRLGIGALIGDEVNIARFGQLKQARRKIDEEIRMLERTIAPIREKGKK